jgi:glycosyltransferase involved in cell wall biosynthesis
MRSPLVSIVIPLFNKEEFILQALSSILAQTYPSWECIIVDDGSTDLSYNRVRDFVNQNKVNCTLLRQKNLGPSAARNLGIESSNGEFIAFLDADDLWLPDKLEKQIDFFERNPTIDLCLSNYLIFHDTNPRRLRAIRAKDPLLQIQNWLSMRGFGGLVESTGVLRKESIDEFLLFDKGLYTTEGLEFTLKWFLARRIAILPELLTLYRISNNQLHTNTELIKKNVSHVLAKYPFLVKGSEDLNSFHEAYFELSQIRTSRFTSKVYLLLIRFLQLDLIFIKMTGSILWRNLRASLISPAKRRECVDFLTQVKKALL